MIETVNGSTNNVLSGGSTVAGSMLEVTNGTALTLEGTVANAGTIVVSGTTSAATLALDGATISGPGKLVTSGVSALIETVSGTADAMKGETLVSGALLEIVSSSTLTLSAGSLGASALAETASGGTAIVSSTLNNGGTLFASGAGSLVDIVGVVNGGIAEVGDGSHAGLPKAILVTAGFDMLRDVAHHYAQKLAKAGNDITYVHYPDLSHAFIQMTAHSKRCLEATQEVAQLLGKALQKVEAAPFNRTA